MVGYALIMESMFNKWSGEKAPPTVKRQTGFCNTTDTYYKTVEPELVYRGFSLEMFATEAEYPEHRAECETIINKICLGTVTESEKLCLFNKLSMCTCCWRHMHMRPDKCCKTHKLVAAIAQQWEHVECDCECRHMMRFLADNM